MVKNIKQFLAFAFLLLVAAGAGPAYTAVYQWSSTAASNATSDPTINWSEGMAPSSVNDSARAMMAAIANWNKDTSGSLVSGGTTSALTLTTNTGFPNLAALNGQRIVFLANNTNVAGATLNVDGTGAVALSMGTAPLADSAIIPGGLYAVTYYSGASQYRLEGLNNSYNVPLGGIIWSTVSTPPNSNFIAPSGQCISTTTYNAYWVAMGSPAPGGCGAGTFAVIDMRGRVPVALDTLNASAANRMTSSGTGCGTAMTSVGAVCANGLEGAAISLAQLPTGITSVGSFTSTQNNVVTSNANTQSFSTNAGGVSVWQAWASGTSQVHTSVTGSLAVTSNNTSGTATPRVQPSIGLIPYLRVI